MGFPLCSVAITTLLGVESDPKSLEQKLQAGSVPFECVFSPLPTPGVLPWAVGGGLLKQGEPMWALSSCQLQTEVQAVSNALPILVSAVVSLTLHRSHLRCKLPLSPTTDHCPQPRQSLPCCGATAQGRQGPWGLLAYIRV